MKITKIELQKNNPDRVNIYVDDKFFCGLDVEILYSLCLKEGNELTEEQKRVIDEQTTLSKCYRKALALLNYRDRTTFELKKKLKEKLFDPEEIEHTINKLKEKGYVNDDNFLETYISLNKEAMSKQKIISKLWQLGVPTDLIKVKLNSNVTDKDEYNSCLETMQNKIRYSVCEKDKLIRHLLYKGYKYDTVLKVLSDHFPQPNKGQ